MKPTQEQLNLLSADGKLVIGCACPGAGKTWTLIEKAKSYQGKVFITTFTRKCRDEIFQRLKRDERYDVVTLHGFAYRMVVRNWERVGQLVGGRDWPTHPIVYDLEQEQKCIQEVHGSYSGELAKAVKHLRKFKLSIGELLHLYSSGVYLNGFSSHLFKMLVEYESNRLASGILVMDDLIVLAKRLVASPDISYDMYNGYESVMIDEAQDLSEQHWSLLEPFFLTNSKMFLIGDLNQSIFGYSGGNGMVLETLSRHPQAKSYGLTYNFRSAERIVETANKVQDEWMVAIRVAQGSVQAWNCEHIADEAALIKLQTNPEDTAVLTRTRKGAEEIGSYLPGYEVMTVHQSKGREFKNCVVANCTSGQFPSAFAKNIEEERNLFYVACSRAKDKLIFTYQNNPARFLDELLREGMVETFDTGRDLPKWNIKTEI